jgi:hypothetical protein
VKNHPAEFFIMRKYADFRETDRTKKRFHARTIRPPPIGLVAFQFCARIEHHRGPRIIERIDVSFQNQLFGSYAKHMLEREQEFAGLRSALDTVQAAVSPKCSKM